MGKKSKYVYPVTYTLSEIGMSSTRMEIFQKLAEKARLVINNRNNIVVGTHRASRRAKGIGIAPHAPISRAIRMFLIEHGLPEEVTCNITWKTINLKERVSKT